jgi:hypothetical protein
MACLRQQGPRQPFRGNIGATLIAVDGRKRARQLGQAVVDDAPDHPSRMILRHPRLQIDIAEQAARAAFVARASVPPCVRPRRSESRHHDRVSDFFSSLLDNFQSCMIPMLRSVGGRDENVFNFLSGDCIKNAEAAANR